MSATDLIAALTASVLLGAAFGLWLVWGAR